MEFVSEQEDKGIWKVKGARIPKKRDMVAGIITPDRNREKEAYYLTPAARDARNRSAEQAGMDRDTPSNS